MEDAEEYTRHQNYGEWSGSNSPGGSGGWIPPRRTFGILRSTKPRKYIPRPKTNKPSHTPPQVSARDLAFGKSEVVPSKKSSSPSARDRAFGKPTVVAKPNVVSKQPTKPQPSAIGKPPLCSKTTKIQAKLNGKSEV